MITLAISIGTTKTDQRRIAEEIPRIVAEDEAYRNAQANGDPVNARVEQQGALAMLSLIAETGYSRLSKKRRLRAGSKIPSSKPPIMRRRMMGGDFKLQPRKKITLGHKVYISFDRGAPQVGDPVNGSLDYIDKSLNEPILYGSDYSS